MQTYKVFFYKVKNYFVRIHINRLAEFENTHNYVYFGLDGGLAVRFFSKQLKQNYALYWAKGLVPIGICFFSSGLFTLFL